MNRALPWIGAGLGLVLGACVTINVYFPAAAAEKAADRIIEEVWGADAEKVPGPSSRLSPRAAPLQIVLRAAAAGLREVVQLVIPTAAAQANLEISTPAINAIQASMKARHAELESFYTSGAVGLTDQGLVALRDAKALSLKDRPTANRLVAAENKDRNNLYRAIAAANGHPEWEPDIRSTFARRWIDRARSGWYYQSAGSWRKR